MHNDFFAASLDWLHHHADKYRKQAGDDAPLIDRKLRHTMRVLGHVRAMEPETGASPDLVQCMEVAAVLHDAGRFPQLVSQQTYDDRQGYNHATAGAELVEQSGLLEPLTQTERAVILDAIRFHNVAALPLGLAPDSQLALDVIRNADKLDAIRNNLSYLNPDAPHGKVLKLGVTWDPEQASDEVVRLALQRKLVPFSAIQWSNDFILFLCCWIYDLHFPYSFKHLRESGYYDALLDKLPDNDRLGPVKNQLREDLIWIAGTTRKR